MRARNVAETCVVFVTCESQEQASGIGRRLVEERLAACANLAGPILSIFHWDGEVEEEDEVLLILKTRKDRFEQLTERVQELHSYEVPEVIALPIIAGLAGYLRWITEETESDGSNNTQSG
jgi:periplasmic divalent cation tolerance protein